MVNEMENTTRREDRTTTFRPYASERNVEIDFITYDEKTSDGFYTLDVKAAETQRLFLGAVGLKNFPDLVTKVSKYFIAHALNCEDVERHNLRLTTASSERLGLEEKRALERIVQAYNESKGCLCP